MQGDTEVGSRGEGGGGKEVGGVGVRGRVCSSRPVLGGVLFILAFSKGKGSIARTPPQAIPGEQCIGGQCTKWVLWSPSGGKCHQPGQIPG